MITIPNIQHTSIIFSTSDLVCFIYICKLVWQKSEESAAVCRLSRAAAAAQQIWTGQRRPHIPGSSNQENQIINKTIIINYKSIDISNNTTVWCLIPHPASSISLWKRCNTEKNDSIVYFYVHGLYHSRYFSDLYFSRHQSQSHVSSSIFRQSWNYSAFDWGRLNVPTP